MPPRYAYWTIIAGGLPTAFRTAGRDELLPTFRRIQQTHPDAEMKYFARGTLWTSPDEARLDLQRRRAAKSGRGPRAGTPGRDREWRPGGSHRDPRQKFKDAKRERNLARRRRRVAHRRDSDASTAGLPQTRPDRIPGRSPERRRDEGARHGRADGKARPEAATRTRRRS